MSSLAKLMLAKGFVVSGSDAVQNQIVSELKAIGINVFVGHNAGNIDDVDLVVYTAAIAKNNAELLYAESKNIPCIDRAEMLGLVAKQYRHVIAVAGTHGKTTTTAMIANAFFVCGKNPTVHIGGNWGKIHGNLHIGGNDIFITEACEYKDSFLSLNPNAAVITNIEKEHLDYFKSMTRIKQSYNTFCKSCDKVFVNKLYSKLINSKHKTFGLGGNIKAKNIVGKNGKYGFDCYIDDEFYATINLGVAGRYNVDNALAAIAVCNSYGLDKQKVAKSFETFDNVDRRFEVMGEYNGGVIIRDYAHHPTEIKNAIKTAGEVYGKPVIVVYQPHTYSRTKTLLSDFIKCFDNACGLILVSTYSAREKFDQKGSCEALALAIRQANSDLRIFGPAAKCCVKDFLSGLNLDQKTVLFLGAGDLVDILQELNLSK